MPKNIKASTNTIVKFNDDEFRSYIFMLQDYLQKLLFSSSFLSWILIRLGSPFSPMLGPKIDPSSALQPGLLNLKRQK